MVNDPPFRSTPLAAVVIKLGIGVLIREVVSQATNTSRTVEEVEMGYFIYLILTLRVAFQPCRSSS